MTTKKNTNQFYQEMLDRPNPLKKMLPPLKGKETGTITITPKGSVKGSSIERPIIDQYYQLKSGGPIMECVWNSQISSDSLYIWNDIWNGGKLISRFFPDDCVEPATIPYLEPAKVIKYKVEVLGPGGWFDGIFGDSSRSFNTLNEAYQYAEAWDRMGNVTRVVEVEE